MSLYATPKIISDPDSCDFYHAIDIPGIGLCGGQWDLRATVKEYLGNYDFRGKRVLEVGTATGFLCFYMESQGADVVAYDLGPGDTWDFLLGPDDNEAEIRRNNALTCQRLNNGFWLCHKAFASRAKMVNGTAYDIPSELGRFDVVTLCAVLLHLRDPLRALQRAIPMAGEAIIITDLMPGWYQKTKSPYAEFVPKPEDKFPYGTRTWWLVSPDLYVSFLKMMGFGDCVVTVSKHVFLPAEAPIDLYTIVGRRI